MRINGSQRWCGNERYENILDFFFNIFFPLMNSQSKINFW